MQTPSPLRGYLVPLLKVFKVFRVVVLRWLILNTRSVERIPKNIKNRLGKLYFQDSDGDHSQETFLLNPMKIESATGWGGLMAPGPQKEALAFLEPFGVGSQGGILGRGKPLEDRGLRGW